MTNGPIFRDFSQKPTVQQSFRKAPVTDDVLPEPQPEPVEERMRVWTTVEGKSFEAEYVMRAGDQLWMKSPNGQKKKVPMKMMSPEDLHYIELLEPPDFQIEFSKRSWQRQEMPNITEVAQDRPIRRFDYVFGAKIKQKGMKPYNHPLTIEYFAVGEEVDGDNYVLFDRGESTFTPSPENKLSHDFFGDKVDVMTWAMAADRPMHGTKYGGFLITIKNERGKIIQHKVTHDFLLENIENLEKVPTGKHFDKMCNRVAPPRPTQDDIYVDSY